MLKIVYVFKKIERFVYIFYKIVLFIIDNKDIYKKIFFVNFKIWDIFWNLSVVENFL